MNSSAACGRSHISQGRKIYYAVHIAAAVVLTLGILILILGSPLKIQAVLGLAWLACMGFLLLSAGIPGSPPHAAL